MIESRVHFHRARSGNRKTDSGSILILALWALLLLSAAVFAWVKFIDQNISFTGDRNDGLTAKALAHSGVIVALHPAVSRLTPILNQQLGPDRGYKVQMTGEGGRLDLKWLFTPPEHPDPGKIAIFQRYLLGRGVTLQQQMRLVDCILDWLTPPNAPQHLNGAKADANYHPPGRESFLSVDELAQVKGSEPLVSQPGWEDDFTIYSGQGVDLQSASLRILEALPGVGQANAVRFLQVRQGPDGMDGTRDDHIFANAAEALSYLGLNSAQINAITSYVYVENPLSTVHLLSTGQCRNVQRRLEVVAKKMNMQPIILSWKEL